MTKAQAIDYMIKHLGVHVFHWLFDPEEYLYADTDGKIYTEEGYLFEDGTPSHNGMQIRVGSTWENGWGAQDLFVSHTVFDTPVDI